ncbi:MAG: hypothetical protein C5B49_00285 [Bdellovibrio sp.]|nr:MAG: hypothetical protein C5B49_00285 [Bdellovibrio sp.]
MIKFFFAISIFFPCVGFSQTDPQNNPYVTDTPATSAASTGYKEGVIFDAAVKIASRATAKDCEINILWHSGLAVGFTGYPAVIEAKTCGEQSLFLEDPNYASAGLLGRLMGQSTMAQRQETIHDVHSIDRIRSNKAFIALWDDAYAQRFLFEEIKKQMADRGYGFVAEDLDSTGVSLKFQKK